MSVAVPATPRRNVLHAHPQGLNTMPSFVLFGLDKSPSVRAARHHQQHDQRAAEQTQHSMLLGRPHLLKKQSHSPRLMQTPIASLGAINIVDQTATAPARLPTGGSHGTSKRQRAADSEGNELNEEEEYHRQRKEAAALAAASSQPSAKRARHSPRHPPISVAGMGLIDFTADQGDDDDLIMVGTSTKPSSRFTRTAQIQNASLKRARPAASPLRTGTTAATAGEPLLKKSKIDKAAAEKERLDYEERYREKYTRAFRNFKFYFDSIDYPARTSLANQVQQLGAVCIPFYYFRLLLCFDLLLNGTLSTAR